MVTPRAVRAIYKNGQLRLLEPLDLADGEEIELMILSERERAHAALSDLLADISLSDEDVDEAALQNEIEESFRDVSPISDAIIEERHEGP